MMSLSVVSMNVHGLNSPFKRSAMWREAIKLKGEILCAQETHFMMTKQPKCTHRAFSNVFQATAPVKKRGVICDQNGRYMILICELNKLHIYTCESICS